MNKGSWALLMVLWALRAADAQALTLDEYIQQVDQRHQGIESLRQSKQASIARRESGDLPLATNLSAHAQMVDNRTLQQLFPGVFFDENKTYDYNVALTKSFSTGTTAQLSGDINQATSAITGNFPGLSGSESTVATGNVGLYLSQSLWKDGWGRSTDLRRERDLQIQTSETQSYDLQEKQLLIQSESAFWDVLYLKEELAQRQESLARAQRIESWVNKRVSNGLGVSADLYNAQGLVASRQLQVLTTLDDLATADKKIRDALEVPEGQPTPELTGSLADRRQLSQMVDGHTGRKVRLDSYLAVLDAKTRATVSKQTEDSFRPDLVVEGKYNTNAPQVIYSANEAIPYLGDTTRPSTMVGVRLSWMLDSDLKNSARGAARADALAAKLKSDRQLLESDSAWSEMNRRHGELTKMIEAADKLATVQEKKAAASRDLLSKGRAITSDTVIAEQDASEARLSLIRLKAEQRKLEAQARLYVTMEEN